MNWLAVRRMSGAGNLYLMRISNGNCYFSVRQRHEEKLCKMKAVFSFSSFEKTWTVNGKTNFNTNVRWKGPWFKVMEKLDASGSSVLTFEEIW